MTSFDRASFQHSTISLVGEPTGMLHSPRLLTSEAFLSSDIPTTAQFTSPLLSLYPSVFPVSAKAKQRASVGRRTRSFPLFPPAKQLLNVGNSGHPRSPAAAAGERASLQPSPSLILRARERAENRGWCGRVPVRESKNETWKDRVPADQGGGYIISYEPRAPYFLSRVWLCHAE